MEELIYIVLIVIWLLVSFLKRKPRSGKSADSQQPAQGEAAPADDKEANVEDMLEEFFGTEAKKEKPQKPEPVFNASGRDAQKDDGYERLEDVREKDLRDQRDETPMWGHEEKKKKKDPRTKQYTGKGGASESVESPSGKKQQTIEELIASHKQEEARRAAREEGYDKAGTGLAGIPDFDLRTAVIFSEILNRKYD